MTDRNGMQDIIQKLMRSEGFLYLFFGGCTTAVNFVSYFLLTRALYVQVLAANGLAWAAAVAFAFAANKRYVFRSKAQGKQMFTELRQFVSGRIFSLALESFCLWFFVTRLHFDDAVVKLLVAVLVVLVNYLISRFIVFRKHK